MVYRCQVAPNDIGPARTLGTGHTCVALGVRTMSGLFLGRDAFVAFPLVATRQCVALDSSNPQVVEPRVCGSTLGV